MASRRKREPVVISATRARARRGDDERAPVVRAERVARGVVVVARGEADGGGDGAGLGELEDDAGGRRLGLARLGVDLGGVELDGADGAGGAVDDELGVDGSWAGVGGLDAGEDGELVAVVVVAFGAEGDEADAGGAGVADGVVLDGWGRLVGAAGADLVEIGDAAVGEDVVDPRGLCGVGRRSLGFGFVVGLVARPVGAGSGAGELDRAFDVRGAVGRRDGLDGSCEAVAVRGHGRDDLGAGAEGDDHGLVGGGAVLEERGRAERLDDLQGAVLGALEAGPGGGAGVEGAHRGAAVDQEDDLASALGGRDGARLGEGEEEQREDEELEEEEEVAPEFLEGGVGLEVLDGLFPEERRGDLAWDAPELEEVEDDQRRDRDRGGECGEHGGGPCHLSMPRLRRYSSRRVSIGMSDWTVMAVISRRAQNSRKARV